MDYKFKLSVGFAESFPIDTARALENFPVEEITAFLSKVDVAISSNILTKMDTNITVKCLESFQLDQTAEVFHWFEPEIAAMYLRKISADRRDILMDSLPPEKVSPIRLKLHYPPGTAGELMEAQVFYLPQDIKIKTSIKRIQRENSRLFDLIFIVDREKKLVGSIQLSKLLRHKENQLLSLLMETQPSFLEDLSSELAILHHPAWKNQQILPVVNKSGLFLGIIELKTVKYLEQKYQEKKSIDGPSGVGLELAKVYWTVMFELYKSILLIFQSKKE